MSKNLLKYLIFAGGVISLLVFIAERSLPVYNFLLIEKQIPEYFEFTKYGELYYFSCIDDFKEDLPKAIDKYRLSDRNSTIDEADIITFGDSYFDFSRQLSLPERLSEETGKNVHTIYSFYPLIYLNQIGYQKQKKKLFIYETAERMIPERFGSGNKMNSTISAPTEGLSIDAFFTRAFNGPNEERLDKILKGSFLTSWIYSRISTFRYHELGYISKQAPDFRTDTDPWLFYGESVNGEKSSIQYQHSDKEIEIYCDNIKLLQDNLKSKYNLDFVFISVPNKITSMRNRLLPPIPYNNLLNRVQEGLRKRGVPYVDLYSEFNKSSDILFYRTDTHWNKKGVDIAVDKILELFKQKNGLNTL